ncbi:hypothetical protein DXG03_001499 [Asterophora parasitica]|uniref:Uncharacterized protein n=1 Tax=Asterophora parasitica TaxID=117018 RepID=A0A9P7KBK4_9AGAR|nr:hypothetical protein DXG03_001499 [Asterophora parasitica]
MRVFHFKVPSLYGCPTYRNAERVAREMHIPRTQRDARNHSLRDGYHCVLTRLYDFYACISFPDLRAHVEQEAKGEVFQTLTEVAYIFPDAQEGEKLEEEPGVVNEYKVRLIDEESFAGFTTAPGPRVTLTVDPNLVTACKANNKPVPALCCTCCVLSRRAHVRSIHA